MPSERAEPPASLPPAFARGERPAITLIHGDLVLAEPAAARLAESLARPAGCTVETHRRPPTLAPLLQDLRTFSLFSAAKVALAVDTAVFADRAAAGELLDEAAEAVPAAGAGRPLAARERRGASLLLQALRLFAIDPEAGSPEQAVAALPDWALEGGAASRRGRGGRARGKRQVEELRAGLAVLLEAARREAIHGHWESDLAELGALVGGLEGGLPPGHALVFAERAVAADHPLVRRLSAQGAVLGVGDVESERGAWEGLGLLAAELERSTGVALTRDALEELGRRTLRQAGDRRGGGGRRGGAVDADSTARFAAEYRKLALLAAGAGETGGRVDRKLVEEAVEDRGEEDVWQLLDAIAASRGGDALGRLRRLLAGADEPASARLAFFSLLASFCRQLTAIRGIMRVTGVPPGEANYARFKSRLAPELQGELEQGKNPLAGLHPFRLHRAYLAASRLPEPFLARLPADILETELQLKGESGEPDAALALLIARLATAGAPSGKSAGR
jgi:hypothetical protein